MLGALASAATPSGPGRRCSLGSGGVVSSQQGQVGLDHYQVQSWTGWHRHTMLALAILTVLVADARDTTPSPGIDTAVNCSS